MKLLHPFFLVFLACLLLQGCLKTYNHQGYVFDQEVMGVVRKGEDRRKIEQYIGTPSVRSYFAKNIVYYIGGEESRFAFFKPRLKSRKVLILTYSPADKLESFEELSLEDMKRVLYETDSTKTYGDDNSIVQQFLGNIGRFKMDTGSQSSPGSGNGMPGG